MDNSTIAIVDIGLDPQSELRDPHVIAEEIDNALSQIGFVYLKGHGIKDETLQAAFAESKTFFQLDENVKITCGSIDEMKSCGYEGRDPTLTQGNTYRETFNLAPQFLESVKDSMKKEALPLISILGNLMTESQPVISKMLSIFSKSLKLEDEEYFWKRCAGLHENSGVANGTRLKTCYYPYIPTMKAGVERCSTHYDFGILTLLWQDQGGGLEIQLKSGEWIPAKPIPGTILVNTGNLLEYWSGGRYPATVHRVGISQTDVDNQLDRQSLAYFIFADDSVRVSPLLTDDVQRTTATSGNDESMTVKEYLLNQLKTVYKQ